MSRVFHDVDGKEGDGASGDGDVILLEASGAEGHGGVSDEAPGDAIGDGVGNAHHDDGDEAARDGDPILPLKPLKVLEHANADVDESQAGDGVAGEGAENGVDEEAQSEEQASDDGGEPGAGAGGDASR